MSDERKTWTHDHLTCKFGWTESEGEKREITELLFRFHPRNPRHPQEEPTLSVSFTGDTRNGLDYVPDSAWENNTPESLTMAQAERLWRFLGAALGK